MIFFSSLSCFLLKWKEKDLIIIVISILVHQAILNVNLFSLQILFLLSRCRQLSKLVLEIVPKVKTSQIRPLKSASKKMHMKVNEPKNTAGKAIVYNL